MLAKGGNTTPERSGGGHCERALAALALLLLARMACCVVVTSTGTVKMVESCGNFHHIARPGLEFVTPCVQQVSGTISMRLQQMEVQCETKTKDNVFITMNVSIQYQVIEEDAKILDAHYRLTNPRVQVRTHTAVPPAWPPRTRRRAAPALLPRLSAWGRRLTCRLPSPRQIESYVYDVVRSTVPKIELDDVFTTKEEISASISDALKGSMASFGYQILSTPITDIDPDREVKRAMNEINKMKR